MTARSEKFCLNWNDFQKNINSSFHYMRDDLDLADVTLICEGRKQFQAHKFVLSASSPFFKEILHNNKHPHPLIYLKGLKARTVESVLDFLYRGEANIYQEYLNEFLTTAEELELKGLTGQQTKEEENLEETYTKHESTKLKVKPKPRKIVLPKTEPDHSNVDEYPVQNYEDIQKVFTTSTDMVAVQAINTNNDELNETTESMLEKIGDTWKCKVCGQKSGHHFTLKRHIESKHTTGGSHPCKVCGKIFRSSHSNNTHVSKYHPK